MSAADRVDPEAVAFLRAAGCVYAEDEARILTEAASSADELEVFLARRAAGEPLEYIVGWAAFSGLRVPVRAGVFVPRRRSEFLAEVAVEVVRETAARLGAAARPVRVLDLCCGSGAIGLVVATQSGDVDLLAADDSPVAVECASANLAGVGGRVYQGDLFEAIPDVERHGLDLIIANAPYVPTGEIPTLPAETRLFEPAPTFDGGPDGTGVQRRILGSAAEWLRAAGVVLVETAAGMADKTARLATDAGFAAEVLTCADLGATVVKATRRP